MDSTTGGPMLADASLETGLVTITQSTVTADHTGGDDTLDVNRGPNADDGKATDSVSVEARPEPSDNVPLGLQGTEYKTLPNVETCRCGGSACRE